jgi:hypothetical protein
VPFWKSMGFKTDEPTDSNFDGREGYLLLEQKNKVAEGAAPADVLLRVFPEAAKWDDRIAPAGEWSPDAVWLDQRRVLFASRQLLLPKALGLSEQDDLVIEIVLDGISLVKGKCKHDEASQLGVKFDGLGCYFIDEIQLGRPND